METDNSKKPKLNRHIFLNELIKQHPQVLEALIVEYGFHCVGCIFAEYETLEQGAAVHGIVGDDFEELLTHLAQIIQESEAAESRQPSQQESGGLGI